MQARDFGEGAKALVQGGNHAAAEDLLRRGVQAFPANPALQSALCILLLRRGEYGEGWKLYESRRRLPSWPGEPPFPFPEWQGQPVRSLLVLPEQGLGDQIQFARYVPVLVQRGISVTLVAPAELARLFSHLGAEVIATNGEVRAPRREAWCFIGSLPRLVGGLPAAPYLPAEPGGRGVGVMLSGSGRNGFQMPGELASRLATLGQSLHPLDSGARDFEETAEMIRKLSVVVSVDTSVAHLAAAMGKLTYVLVPSEADWRWGQTGPLTPWYPTARLFRIC